MPGAGPSPQHLNIGPPGPGTPHAPWPLTRCRPVSLAASSKHSNRGSVSGPFDVTDGAADN